MFTIHKDFFAIIALAVFIIVNQFYLIPQEVLAYGTSATYPHLINLAIAAFTVCYLFEALRRRKLKTDGKAQFTVNVKHMAKPVGLLLSIWLWVEFAEHMGFLMPSAMLLAVSSLLYGERSPKSIILVSVITPLFILFFFTSLNSALPEGPLETMLLGVIRS